MRSWSEAEADQTPLEVGVELMHPQGWMLLVRVQQVERT